jgi:hypothetical protein
MKDGSLARKEAPETNPNGQHTKIKKHPPGVSRDPVPITKREEVVWDPPDGGGDFKVHFDDSPFEERDFDASHNHSGAPVVDVPPGETRRFKYSVTVDGETEDPIVVVRG